MSEVKYAVRRQAPRSLRVLWFTGNNAQAALKFAPNTFGVNGDGELIWTNPTVVPVCYPVWIVDNGESIGFPKRFELWDHEAFAREFELVGAQANAVAPEEFYSANSELTVQAMQFRQGKYHEVFKFVGDARKSRSRYIGTYIASFTIEKERAISLCTIYDGQWVVKIGRKFIGLDEHVFRALFHKAPIPEPATVPEAEKPEAAPAWTRVDSEVYQRLRLYMQESRIRPDELTEFLKLSKKAEDLGISAAFPPIATTQQVVNVTPLTLPDAKASWPIEKYEIRSAEYVPRDCTGDWLARRLVDRPSAALYARGSEGQEERMQNPRTVTHFRKLVRLKMPVAGVNPLHNLPAVQFLPREIEQVVEVLTLFRANWSYGLEDKRPVFKVQTAAGAVPVAQGDWIVETSPGVCEVFSSESVWQVMNPPRSTP